eukprot:TRINITY_DN8622_c0_g1_i2.p1 TRINITY_DN8622_c0_g1~~TRINITY_DN8622_c0_g1_i2.p1  ORF type:complete len:100 (-),score=0.22 TRINITY_DN8622_c0_g1_i2:22-321(-)
MFIRDSFSSFCFVCCFFFFFFSLCNGVDNGARTHDRRNHNPELYQLSYAHHRDVLQMVRTERLELSHLAAPEPKSGVSTNSTTSAYLLENGVDLSLIHI